MRSALGDRYSSINGSNAGAIKATLAGGAVVVVAVVATAAQKSLTLVDIFVLLGVAVVLPLALGHRWWPWNVAALGVGIALFEPIGWRSAVFVAPWAMASLSAIYAYIRTKNPGASTLQQRAMVVAAGYSLVAAGAFLMSRLGVFLFGVGEPIVELTAVHFAYAGAAALVLAARFLTDADRGARRAALVATVVTAIAPPIVATGFVTHAAFAQVGGAVAMTIGVWMTATLELRAAVGLRHRIAPRALLLVSGLAIWIPMVLAVAWAAGQHWDVPALSIPEMERTHGVANALAFVLCGLLARSVQAADGVAESRSDLGKDLKPRSEADQAASAPRDRPPMAAAIASVAGEAGGA